MVHEQGWQIIGNPNGAVIFKNKYGQAFESRLPPLRKDVTARIAGLVSDNSEFGVDENRLQPDSLRDTGTG